MNNNHFQTTTRQEASSTRWFNYFQSYISGFASSRCHHKVFDKNLKFMIFRINRINNIKGILALTIPTRKKSLFRWKFSLIQPFLLEMLKESIFSALVTSGENACLGHQLVLVEEYLGGLKCSLLFWLFFTYHLLLLSFNL